MAIIYIYIYIYFFFFLIYGCVGSSFLWEGFLQLWQAGATLHRGARASHHHGLSLWSTGSRRAGSAVVAHGPSCSAACGIFPEQGSNPCPLHWQADSQPLRHQGSPAIIFNIEVIHVHCRKFKKTNKPKKEKHHYNPNHFLYFYFLLVLFL